MVLTAVCKGLNDGWAYKVSFVKFYLVKFISYLTALSNPVVGVFIRNELVVHLVVCKASHPLHC